jgi:ABC-2 type transport system ATP-binding protein
MLVATDTLTKRYGAFTALESCSLTVDRGEIFGLLGPNGAGKTTLLRLLMGYIVPTAGTARIAGFDCRRDEAARVADRLELDCRRQVARMSTGMRQKLALAVVLATDAALVILDEPTANLDPTARAEVLKLVLEARAAGRTVIFSSHVLSEVEETCDRVVIVRRGSIVHEQSIEAMRRSHRITARLTGPIGDVPAELRGHVTVTAAETADALRGVTIESSDNLAPLLGWLARLPLDEVRIEPVGLSAVYDQFK